MARIFLTLLLAGLASGCARSAPERPSILLVVFDTLRADAVASYGGPPGVTPQLERLAEQGLVYTRAYAPSPWTLPSHAALFTGVGQDVHRVGAKGGALLAEELVTLAERLRSEGYQTAAVSESALIDDAFQMLQGFDLRRTPAPQPAQPFVVVDPVEEVAAWLSERDPDRPLFLFVNLYDPHAPYEIREQNRFVPASADEAHVRARSPRPSGLLCGAVPTRDEIDILHGLYLGDVHEADAKFARIHALLAESDFGGDLITIATSDHGEHFGERRLMGHEFSVHDALLRIPLIVHGLPGAAPAEIGAPVTLADVTASVLRWTGTPGGEQLAGRPLPEIPTPADEAAPQRALFAALSDESWILPKAWEGKRTLGDQDRKRGFCGPSDRVHGAMAALIRHPFKYVWYERYPPELFDLSWDATERSDLSGQRPALAAEFAEAIEGPVAASGVVGAPAGDAQPISEEAAEALRRLGYVE